MTNVIPYRQIEANVMNLFNQEIDICAFEKELLSLEQEEIEPEHIFSGGVYIRQIRIPKGTLIIGKRHRHATCNILMDGDLSLYVGGGSPPVRVTGPLVFESPPNSKKMGFAHKDTIFMNIHPTELTDLVEIEKEFIISEEEFLLIGGAKCLGEQL